MLIDKICEEVKRKGNVCVGLDTHLDYIPEQMKNAYQDIEESVFQFNKRIIDQTMDIVPVYKLQIAYYEALGIKGLLAYKKTLKYLKTNKSISIADIKRGDISATAEMYGKAHFEGDFEADFITLNPYMGFDSIVPYLKYIESGDKGIFVLLRTSNQGAKDIQYLHVKEGTDKNTMLNGGIHLYYYIGDRLNEMAAKYRGRWGYSPIGAVVGGTHANGAKELRDRYNNLFFLIPGYGHQGAKGKDIRNYLINGNGGVVNSSRGIITAYKKHEDGIENFDKYIRLAVLSMKEDIEGGGSL